MILTDRHWCPGDTLAIKRITSLDVSPNGRRLYLIFAILAVILLWLTSRFWLQDKRTKSMIRREQERLTK